MSASRNTAPSSPAPLPVRDNANGDPRRVGVEIEFGALAEEQVTGVITERMGGQVEQRGERGYVVTDTELGDIEVYLDTQYLKRAESGFQQRIHDIARQVVPVEIVTGPILPAEITKLDALCADLAKAGATGTAAGVFLGFGVHFNPEVTGETLPDILPTLRAFAFLEDSIRDAARIDLARRVMPYVDAYPRPLLDGLAEEIGSLDALIDLYLDRAPSRNHGLDMLCLFAHLDEARVAGAMDMNLISPRPTYHYRLPDCRIDEPDWSLSLEWQRWVRIEEVAQDAGLIGDLCAAWRDHRAHLTTTRSDWAKRAADIVGGIS
ncbi:Putative amidoligase enzyme [Roseivivax sp. THAF40]|uniref:amidoligase family protein n=1 Tax=Roseivivax sp. THAF40 TaxID=2587858 RepID=UPI001267F579|nr:amidoligase family protein [Roseivivax sp. THAF40]QFT46821.1 Putative amidoligase enzyme [Roseivivax sp. THAF40]